MQRLTILDIGLLSVDKMGVGENRQSDLYDGLIAQHEHLSALVSIMQLPSIVSSPSFTALLDSSTLRSAVRHLLLHTVEQRVKVSEVLEMLDILKDERNKHMERYKRPIPLAHQQLFTLSTLLRELVQGCSKELAEVQWSGVPVSFSFDALLSPSVLLSLCGGADMLQRLHNVLVLYSSAVPAGELDWSTDIIQPLRTASSWSDYVENWQTPGPVPLAALVVELLCLSLGSGASHAIFPHSYQWYSHELHAELSALLKREEKDCVAAVAFLHQAVLEECVKRSRDMQHMGRTLTQPQSQAVDALLSATKLSWLMAGQETALLDESTVLLVCALLGVKQRRQKLAEDEASKWWTAMAHLVHPHTHPHNNSLLTHLPAVDCSLLTILAVPVRLCCA